MNRWMREGQFAASQGSLHHSIHRKGHSSMRPAPALSHCQTGKLRLRGSRTSLTTPGFRPCNLCLSLCSVLISKDRSSHTHSFDSLLSPPHPAPIPP
jgi:hypothetical protein